MTHSETPLISVIVPVYNGARYIADALNSIVAQQYNPLEIIVVDDGSVDDSAEITKNFNAPITYIYQSNQGPAAARNTGLVQAQGSVIAFCDADDLWPARKLATQLPYLAVQPNTDVVLGRTQGVHLAGAAEDEALFDGPNNTTIGVFLGSGLYRKNAFERIGNFDATLRYSEDHDWFLRAREQQLNIHKIDDITLIYRRHGANMTKSAETETFNLPLVLMRSLRRRRAQATQLAELTSNE